MADTKFSAPVTPPHATDFARTDENHLCQRHFETPPPLELGTPLQLGGQAASTWGRVPAPPPSSAQNAGQPATSHSVLGDEGGLRGGHSHAKK